MNGVGFEILARTPVPKLPLSYPLKGETVGKIHLPCMASLYFWNMYLSRYVLLYVLSGMVHVFRYKIYSITHFTNL